jgi:hypothetical protein
LPYHLAATPPTTPPTKPADSSYMLVWGGSSVTGQFLIQMAGDDVTMGVDLVGAKSAVATLKCLSTTRTAQFAPLAWAPKVEVGDNIETLNVEMKQFVLNPASAVYAAQLTRLVEEGEIRLPEIEVLSGGLEVVEQGLERLKRGDMAGKKLVVDMLS